MYIISTGILYLTSTLVSNTGAVVSAMGRDFGTILTFSES